MKPAYAALLLLGAVSARAELVFVGSQDRQIQALHLDPASGRLAPAGRVADGIRPTWLASHPRLPVLYAVDDENAREGTVTAFSVNRTTGALTKINDTATQGTGTTNLYLDAPSMTLLAANYGSGSVSSLVLNDDGSVGALASTVTESGSGPARRQASAHAHNAVVDPSGRYVLVPDLGADRVFVYDFDRSTHTLSAGDAGASRAFVAPPGSGPRHLAFGADGRHVYLITELSAEVMVFEWDAPQGRLRQIQSLPVSSTGFQGAKSGAEIAVSRDGRFVYVENRGENQMVVYRVDEASGELSEIQRIPAGGDKPWGFAIDASGKWLIVANQHSGSINVFAVDTASGKLADTGYSADIPTPVSIAFMP